MNSVYKQSGKMELHREIPTLLELCTKTAIANLRYMGDVGETDLHLLENILPHCTIEQLECIEDETERDLTLVTNELWKKFYEYSFGTESMNHVIKQMKEKKRLFPWRQLYKAKKHEREQASIKSGERLKRRYEEEREKKQSRQTKLCEKLPPGGTRRTFFGGSRSDDRFVNSRSNLMKKSRIEYLRCTEAQNKASTMRRKEVQKYSLCHQSAPGGSKANSLAHSDSASSSRKKKPPSRR